MHADRTVSLLVLPAGLAHSSALATSGAGRCCCRIRTVTTALAPTTLQLLLLAFYTLALALALARLVLVLLSSRLAVSCCMMMSRLGRWWVEQRLLLLGSRAQQLRSNAHAACKRSHVGCTPCVRLVHAGHACSCALLW